MARKKIKKYGQSKGKDSQMSSTPMSKKWEEPAPIVKDESKTKSKLKTGHSYKF